jgi:hypothetical protein
MLRGACYRVHPASASTSLMLEIFDTRDVRNMIDMTMTYHPLNRGTVLARRARTFWVGVAIENSRHLLVKGARWSCQKASYQCLALISKLSGFTAVLFFSNFARACYGAQVKRCLRQVAGCKIFTLAGFL